MEPDATVLAFDFGTRRIGVAIGNTVTRVARPLQTIDAANPERRFDAIRALLEEWQPQRLVVGLPVHADGMAHGLTSRAHQFAKELERRFDIPVAMADERYTSQTAHDALAAAGQGGRDRRALRDPVAAQIILQAWLDDAHDR